MLMAGEALRIPSVWLYPIEPVSLPCSYALSDEPSEPCRPLAKRGRGMGGRGDVEGIEREVSS